MVLFGHTHAPFKDRNLGIEVLNPGTISNVQHPSYGVVAISAGIITTAIKCLG